MGLSLRRAYEKIGTPERTVRRGRDPSLPVSIYQELDSLTRQVDSLVLLSGANKEALSAILKSATGSTLVPITPPPTGGGTTPPGGGTPSEVRTRTTVFFPFNTTAGAHPATDFIAIPTKFEILKVTYLVESSTGANVSARARLDYRRQGQSGSGNDIVKSTLSLTFQHLVEKSATQHQMGLAETLGDATFEAGALRLRLTFASPDCRVSGSILMDLITTTGGS